MDSRLSARRYCRTSTPAGYVYEDYEDQRKNPFIADKPDHEKTQAELIEELRYMRAENDYLKHMKALNEKNAAKAAKPFKR
ncbi:transposase [Neisseria dentiae]|nr:transposase [Neisseria dentiae]